MKENTKKKLLIGTFALSLFGAGTFTGGAANTWVQEFIAKGQERIGKSAYTKKEELINNMDAKIQEKLSQSMESKITSREQQVAQELEDYFDHKVAELDGGENSVVIEESFDTKANDIVEQYKLQIDQAFEGVQ